ncbi:hypothetical protein Droror1_Dr00017168 [Drosera rotundifolia]
MATGDRGIHQGRNPNPSCEQLHAVACNPRDATLVATGGETEHVFSWRIGQPVDLDIDLGGSGFVFLGRRNCWNGGPYLLLRHDNERSSVVTSSSGYDLRASPAHGKFSDGFLADSTVKANGAPRQGHLAECLASSASSDTRTGVIA